MRCKVVHIITGLEVGGAESFLARLLPMLKPSCDNTVISLSGLGVIGPKIIAEGVPVHTLDMVRNRPSLGKYLQLVRLLKDLRPDVVHTWLYHADLMGGLAARHARVPTVMWNIRQTNLSPDYIKRSTLMVAKACAALSGLIPDVVVCCADAARTSHVAMGYAADRMVVIPNGFDLSRFRPDPTLRSAARQVFGAGPGDEVAGAFARFDPQKNHFGLLQAVAQLRDRNGLKLVLAGRGMTPDNTELASWIAAAGLQDRAVLLGLRQDVERLLPGLDVFVSASKDEGFPNAIAEAMACGVPCAVTDVGDSRLLVADTGRLAPPADDDALAMAMRDVLDLPGPERESLGDAARRRIVSEFDLAGIAGRYADLYARSIERGAPHPSVLHGNGRASDPA